MKTFIICAILCLSCSIAFAQTLELDDNVKIQDDGISYVAPMPDDFSPFDRDVHVGTRYGWGEKSVYENDIQEFSEIGLTFHAYGERFWGFGVGVSYLIEEDISSSTTISMFSLDIMASLRFPVYFVDIFINGGVTLPALTVDDSSANSSSDSDENIINIGAFIEVGGRLYITRILNANLAARYSTLEVNEKGEDYDMSGFSVFVGLGYAFY